LVIDVPIIQKLLKYYKLLLKEKAAQMSSVQWGRADFLNGVKSRRLTITLGVVEGYFSDLTGLENNPNLYTKT